jgi:DNA-binding Lrp family transcriptional regulator
MNMPDIDDVDKAILNRIQSDFPITSRPYRTIAEDLGLSEGEVLKRWRQFQARKTWICQHAVRRKSTRREDQPIC